MVPVTVSPLDPLIPVIIMLVKQSGFPSKWNALLALGVYVVWTAVSLALGIRAVEGDITVEIFLNNLVGAAAAGYLSYQLFWKGLTENRITDATSFVKPPVSDEIEGDEAPNGLDG